MRKMFLFFITLTISLLTTAQGYKELNPITYTESDKNDTVYTVEGYRHGVSFFPQVQHRAVEYVKGDKLTFDTFHSNDVINE